MHWLFDPYLYSEAQPSVRITNHARHRLTLRTKIPADEADWFAAQALRYGHSVSNCRGNLQCFLYDKAAHGLWPVIYIELVLLFAPSGDGSLTLITVYPLPDCYAAPGGKRSRRQRRFPFSAALPLSNARRYVPLTEHIHPTAYEFRPILALAPDSFRRIADSFTPLDLLIGKTGEGIMAFAALRCPQSEAMLAAAKMKVGPPVSIILEKGIPLEREAQRVRRAGAYAIENGKRILHPVSRPACFANLSHVLEKSDYVRLTLTPADKPLLPHNGYASAANAAFQSTSCYGFALEASCRKVADALIADLRTSGGEFCIQESTWNAEAPKRVGPHVLTDLEAGFLLGGMGDLCSEMFPKTLHSTMAPTQAVNLPKPDIVIGKNSGQSVGFRLSDLLTNLAVIGLSGSGKTTILKRIAAALHNQGVPLVIIAPLKYDFSEALPGCDLYREGDDDHPLRFNILDVPPTQEAVSIAAAALGQVIPASVEWLEMFYANTLTGLLAASNGDPVGLSDLARACKADFDLSGYIANRESLSMKEAMLNRPKNVYMKPEFNTSVSNISFDRMMEPDRITVIELHSMEPSDRRVFGAVFLQRLMHEYRSRLKASVTSCHLAIIIDELHELLAPDGAGSDAFRDALLSSISTARGMGISHILADQRFDLMAEIATHGCSSHIFLNQPSSEQIAKLLSLPGESDAIELMPFFNVGEGLLHITRSRTIPFDGKLAAEEAPLPVIPAEAPAKAFLPYPSVCSQTCKSCCFTLHKAVFDGVAGQLSGAGGVYGDYVRAVRAAKELDDPKARSNAIYLAKGKLLAACVDAALKKAKAAGLTGEKLPILQHCVRHELQRQLSFRT